MLEVSRGLTRGEDGYELWLRYERPWSDARRAEYRRALGRIRVFGSSQTAKAIVAELNHALPSLLDVTSIVCSDEHHALDFEGLVVASLEAHPALESVWGSLSDLGQSGYKIISQVTASGASQLVVLAKTDVGALYGTFALLRRMSRGLSVTEFKESSSPRVQLRMVNHWDNLDGTIERGFAGSSLWNWYQLPEIVSPRYTDYARASASIGINGVALTNVNANALILSKESIHKAAAIADVFRPYGIRIFLTARFSAPVQLAGLLTADPREPSVQKWWQDKCDEIYRSIPDFGGFVVKANSEGQPGPQDYGRSHAEGANLLGAALKKHGGFVIWRAFVYSAEAPEDRVTQAYSEFAPLDGQFLDNALVQVKNGPLDFQPREPHHPLFGSMPQTPLLIEFQMTQEYLGNSKHLAYLGPLFSEVLQTETCHAGYAGATKDTRVARVVDGTLHGNAITGMSAVINVGSDPNWCGHHFAQANWYAYGRLAWDPDADPEVLAQEWLEQTFSSRPAFVKEALSIMSESREAVVDYMTPLGLSHIMAYDHHQGPGPWVVGSRPDWSSTYYHRADREGIGFDRTASGSNSLSQYPSGYRKVMEDIDTCPLRFLLWYHRVAWDHRLSTGHTLWDELCLCYQRGVDKVRIMQAKWQALEASVDPLRHKAVSDALGVQVKEAVWWKDACLTYFQSFSDRPYPAGVQAPRKTLQEYQAIEQYFVPGIPERRV